MKLQRALLRAADKKINFFKIMLDIRVAFIYNKLC